MHVLVVGGGGREHALAWKLAQSPRINRISVAPGNGGTATLARRVQNVDIDATDIVSLLDFAEEQAVDLTIVGPEEPLAGGLVDQFEAAGLRIFGPRRKAALIEASKSFAKQLMVRNGVPTAPYELFTDIDRAMEFLAIHLYDDVVIKADGLSRGKGVFLPRGESDAEGILRSLLERNALGRAGRQVLIEQRLVGPEISVMAFIDGSTIAMIPAVCDHKRLYNNDVGPNTGGMGSYAPAPALTPHLAESVRREIIEPALRGLHAEGCEFRGVLNLGIVLTAGGPMALELNVRFGDPGAQAVLPLLESDLLDVIEACVEGRLGEIEVRWRPQASVTVVMSTSGYPHHPDPGLPILQAPVFPAGVTVFHAGTRIVEDGSLVTTGGRIVGLTGVGPDLPAAITRAYEATRRVYFDGVHYRTDIGARAVWRV
ncbi:MAG: phosphoribosylamine--glycine ligase [Chloroflexi bacterium]|nr:phosphoribosylamine--glycine ligase [Chloroflexota bacterium]